MDGDGLKGKSNLLITEHFLGAWHPILLTGCQGSISWPLTGTLRGPRRAGYLQLTTRSCGVLPLSWSLGEAAATVCVTSELLLSSGKTNGSHLLLHEEEITALGTHLFVGLIC